MAGHSERFPHDRRKSRHRTFGIDEDLFRSWSSSRLSRELPSRKGPASSDGGESASACVSLGTAILDDESREWVARRLGNRELVLQPKAGVAGAVVKNYFLKPARRIQAIPAGTRLSLPNVDWSKRERTLVVALHEDCAYCSESATFYQRLVRETRGNGRVGLVAVLPQEVSQARSYLHGLGLDIDDVRQLPLRSIGVAATPTLALVDSRGIVVQSWVGKLSASKESEVLSAVAGTGGKAHG